MVLLLMEKGSKCLKSLGNIIAPEDILKKYGADILRVWVAAADYSEDFKNRLIYFNKLCR